MQRHVSVMKGIPQIYGEEGDLVAMIYMFCSKNRGRVAKDLAILLGYLVQTCRVMDFMRKGGVGRTGKSAILLVELGTQLPPRRPPTAASFTPNKPTSESVSRLPRIYYHTSDSHLNNVQDPLMFSLSAGDDIDNRSFLYSQADAHIIIVNIVSTHDTSTSYIRTCTRPLLSS